MTKKVADYLTNNMCLEGVIIEHDKSVYSYFIQIIIERTIGFLTIYVCVQVHISKIIFGKIIIK